MHGSEPNLLSIHPGDRPLYRAIALVIVLFASLPAFAQQAPCAEREAALKKLSNDYGESQVALGLTSDGNVLEVLASSNGTWTILVTTPQGLSCGVASGQAWTKAPKRQNKNLGVGL